jgi:hypothetical protein
MAYIVIMPASTITTTPSNNIPYGEEIWIELSPDTDTVDYQLDDNISANVDILENASGKRGHGSRIIVRPTMVEGTAVLTVTAAGSGIRATLVINNTHSHYLTFRPGNLIRGQPFLDGDRARSLASNNSNYDSWYGAMTGVMRATPQSSNPNSVDPRKLWQSNGAVPGLSGVTWRQVLEPYSREFAVNPSTETIEVSRPGANVWGDFLDVSYPSASDSSAAGAYKKMNFFKVWIDNANKRVFVIPAMIEQAGSFSAIVDNHRKNATGSYNFFSDEKNFEIRTVGTRQTAPLQAMFYYQSIDMKFVMETGSNTNPTYSNITSDNTAIHISNQIGSPQTSSPQTSAFVKIVVHGDVERHYPNSGYSIGRVAAVNVPPDKLVAGYSGSYHILDDAWNSGIQISGSTGATMNQYNYVTVRNRTTGPASAVPPLVLKSQEYWDTLKIYYDFMDGRHARDAANATFNAIGSPGGSYQKNFIVYKDTWGTQ